MPSYGKCKRFYLKEEALHTSSFSVQYCPASSCCLRIRKSGYCRQIAPVHFKYLPSKIQAFTIDHDESILLATAVFPNETVTLHTYMHNNIIIK